MTKRAALPAPLTRTMLSAVSGSRHFPGLSLLKRRALCGALSLGLLASPAAVLAQQADDGGWFDPPPAGGVPDPYYAGPDGAPAAPVAPELAEVADTDSSALTTFRPALDPYGNWVADPTYGTVWVPHSHVVGSDFAPYVSRGRWALTADDDWIWVSDYPFGWATFHYGRWVWLSGHGWSWVPGRTYANAWVVWRVPSAGYAYVGWAPMPPSYVWVDGVAVSLWYAPPVPYVFCHSSFLFHHHVHHHIVHDRHLVHRIAAHTHVYPTPYRTPARPSARTAASPNVRPSAPPPSSAPRGPRLSAARVPASAIPSERTAPPASAARLAGSRRVAGSRDFTGQRATPAQARPSTAAVQRLPSEARLPVTTEPVRRSTPSAAPSTADRSRSTAERVRSSAPVRSSVPSRTRVAEPRSVAPVRARPSSRDFAPSTSPVRRHRRP